ARAARQHRQVREEGLHAAEAPGRAGRAAAPRSSRREDDEADKRAGGLYRRARGRAVQTGPLSVLAQSMRECTNARMHIACIGALEHFCITAEMLKCTNAR